MNQEQQIIPVPSPTIYEDEQEMLNRNGGSAIVPHTQPVCQISKVYRVKARLRGGATIADSQFPLSISCSYSLTVAPGLGVICCSWLMLIVK